MSKKTSPLIWPRQKG